jgi:hypothetical protein
MDNLIECKPSANVNYPLCFNGLSVYAGNVPWVGRCILHLHNANVIAECKRFMSFVMLINGLGCMGGYGIGYLCMVRIPWHKFHSMYSRYHANYATLFARFFVQAGGRGA